MEKGWGEGGGEGGGFLRDLRQSTLAPIDPGHSQRSPHAPVYLDQGDGVEAIPGEPAGGAFKTLRKNYSEFGDRFTRTAATTGDDGVKGDGWKWTEHNNWEVSKGVLEPKWWFAAAVACFAALSNPSLPGSGAWRGLWC